MSPLPADVVPHTAPAAQAVVDLAAIAHNTAVLLDCAAGAAVMAVVKADGYGHGATAVGRAALAAGATELGVATVDEALALRADGVTAPVLAWLHAPGTDFAAALRAGVGLAVSSARQVADVVDAAVRTGVTAEVTLKIDTGARRNGMPPADLPAVARALLAAQAERSVRLRGAMTHLACADEPAHPETDRQVALFTALVADLRRRGLRPEVLHVANSPATLSRPDCAFDMVRPGVAVYGLDPLRRPEDSPLRPAMTLCAAVASVKAVAAGEGVSYGHTWVAPHDTTVALLPIGYADGVTRALSNRFEVLLGGRRRRSVGRVCMDQCVVDLGPGPTDVGEGDVAVLFGSGGPAVPGGEAAPTAQEWADLLDTLHYEVVTGVRGRVRRTYRNAPA